MNKSERKHLKTIEGLLAEHLKGMKVSTRGYGSVKQAHDMLSDMLRPNHKCSRCGNMRAQWKQRLCRWCKGQETLSRQWSNYWVNKPTHPIVDKGFAMLKDKEPYWKK